MRIDSTITNNTSDVLGRTSSEAKEEATTNEIAALNAFTEPVSPLAAEKTKEDLNGLRKTLLETLSVFEEIAEENKISLEELFHYLNKKGLTLEELATKENYLESESLKEIRFKLAKEKQDKLQALVKKAQNYKSWDRLASVTAVGAGTANALASKNPLAIVFACISLSSFVDEELGRPCKRGIISLFTGDSQSEESKQYAGYLNLLFEVTSLVVTGHSLLKANQNLGENANPKLNISSLFLGTTKVAESASQGVAAWKEYETTRAEGDLLEHREEIERLDETLKLRAEELGRIYRSLSANRESQLKINEANIHLTRMVQKRS